MERLACEYAKPRATITSQMAQTHFENKIEDEKRKTVEAMLALPLGDSHQHARLVGVHTGLILALKLAREAAGKDADDAGDL